MKAWLSQQLELSESVKHVAVLGSGPSLLKYSGVEPFAVAVNGASLYEQRHHLFVCGDLKSPTRSWFYGGQPAKRLVASFLAPRDAILFPEVAVRRCELRRLRWASVKALWQQSMTPYYDFRPKAKATKGHGWFCYTRDAFVPALHNLPSYLERGTLLHGATISGVAVQIAACLGAEKISIYGVSMDNDSGQHYFRSGLVGDLTKTTQRTNFALLLDKVRAMGVQIEQI